MAKTQAEENEATTPDLTVPGLDPVVILDPANQPPESKSGGVRLATRWGHAFRSHNPAIPTIVETGVQLSRTDADEVLAEARGVYGENTDLLIFEDQNPDE
jgi:hypothetical protein